MEMFLPKYQSLTSLLAVRLQRLIWPWDPVELLLSLKMTLLASVCIHWTHSRGGILTLYRPQQAVFP